MFTTKFGAKLAEGIAGQWAAQKLDPAVFFWAGWLLWRHGKWQFVGKWCNWLKAMDNTSAPIALAMSGLLLLAVSSAAAQWLPTTVTRLAEVIRMRNDEMEEGGGWSGDCFELGMRSR
ncbi:MAG: hypothetical protein GY859_44090 [Desulfobacterales bacterium]|nr:hypothetical protein [Desulfobacterales bacterium]